MAALRLDCVPHGKVADGALMALEERLRELGFIAGHPAADVFSKVAESTLGRACEPHTIIIAVHLCSLVVMLRATSRILSRTKNVFRILTTSRSFPHYVIIPPYRVPVTYHPRYAVASQPSASLQLAREREKERERGKERWRRRERTATPETASEPERERRLQRLREQAAEPAVPLRRRNIGRKG